MLAIVLVERLLDILQWLIIFRALISWFPNLRGSKVDQFLYMCTEPVIQPFRVLMERLGLFQGTPFDFSTLAAFIVIAVLQTLLASFA